jgi:hypothetical protein
MDQISRRSLAAFAIESGLIEIKASRRSWFYSPASNADNGGRSGKVQQGNCAIVDGAIHPLDGRHYLAERSFLLL